MGQQILNKVIELRPFENNAEELHVTGVQSDPQGHLVLSRTQTVSNHIIYHCFVLVMFFHLGLPLTAFDVAFNALVDQYFCELVLASPNVELPGGLESVPQSFVVVVEVEVEFGEENGNYGSVGEGLIFVEGFTRW